MLQSAPTHDPSQAIRIKTTAKIPIIGSAGVGKTVLAFRFTDNKYDPFQHMTLAIETYALTVPVHGELVRVQLVDTAGQEQHHAVANSFIRNAHGVVIVYDITNRRSFEDLRLHLHRVETLCPPDSPKLLIGAKCDDQAHRVVTQDEGQRFAQECGAAFFEVSAKTNVDVTKALQWIIKKAAHYSCLPRKDQDNAQPQKVNPDAEEKSVGWLEWFCPLFFGGKKRNKE